MAPKEIASIDWLRCLQKLESFYLPGIRIGDGELHPLLELPKLRDVFMSPVPKSYSHDEASSNAAMRAQRGCKSKFGVPRPSMFDVMKAFMDKPNSGWPSLGEARRYCQRFPVSEENR